MLTKYLRFRLTIFVPEGLFTERLPLLSVFAVIFHIYVQSKVYMKCT